MNAYAEIIDKNGEDCFYVEVIVRNGEMVIKRHQGMYKVNERKINISKISHLKFKKIGKTEQVTFTYSHDSYTFYDFSYQIAGYLRTELVGRLFSKAV